MLSGFWGNEKDGKEVEELRKEVEGLRLKIEGGERREVERVEREEKEGRERWWKVWRWGVWRGKVNKREEVIEGDK